MTFVPLLSNNFLLQAGVKSVGSVCCSVALRWQNLGMVEVKDVHHLDCLHLSEWSLICTPAWWLWSVQLPPLLEGWVAQGIFLHPPSLFPSF